MADDEGGRPRGTGPAEADRTVDEATDDDPPRPGGVGRRRLLALTGVTAAGALAGCGGGGDGDGSDGDGTTDSPASTTSEAPPSTPTPATSTDSGTTEPSSTAEPTSTAVPELTDARQVLTAPSAHNHPLDGFANADWLVEDAEEIQIIPVTTLDARGPGSLRSAMRTPGPRIIVFEVGGVIDLDGGEIQVKPVETSLGGRDLSRCYIAGQTAPDPGITIVRGEVSLYARNTIMQHVRVRCGDDVGDAYDSVSLGSLAADCVVDHCSVSWSIDENLSADGGRTDIPGKTLSNNLVAEALYDSVHPKGPHSMGSLISQNQRDFAMIGNLYSSHDQRHPRLKGGVHGVVVNNYVYNFGVAIGMGDQGETAATATVESNHWTAGADTNTEAPIVHPDDGAPNKPEVYVADNRLEPDSMPLVADRYMGRLDERPYWPETLAALPSDDVAESVLGSAGARPARRTHHDERVVRDVRNDAGAIIDSQSEVGGYPDLESTERSLDPPEYGPEFAAWLRQHTRAVELGEEPPAA